MPEGRDELGGAPGHLLVFVFAVTQFTTLLAERPSWGRFGESMLALALVWWAWSAFVWAANAQTTGSRATGLSAADAYSYLHLVIMAGIIIYAGGSSWWSTTRSRRRCPALAAWPSAVGAVYLLGLGAFRLRVFGELGYGRVAAALGLIALFALGASIPAWTVAGIAALADGLCLSESLAGGPAED